MNSSISSTKGKLVKPENNLKKKVGNGGFDAKTLSAAQHMIENNTVDFRPQARELSDELGVALSAARAAQDASDPSIMGNLMYPVMQLKAQGGLFHYPLISEISHIIIDFLENIPGLDEIVMDITDAYRKAINAIVTAQLKDGNSGNGKDLRNELDRVCNRYYKLKKMG